MDDREEGSRGIDIRQVDQGGSWCGMRKVQWEDHSSRRRSRAVDMFENGFTGDMLAKSMDHKPCWRTCVGRKYRALLQHSL